MQVSLNDWMNFKDRLSRISKTAAQQMADFVMAGGGYANMPTEDVIAYATALAQTYGEASGALSAMMYDAIAELSNAVVEAAEIAPVASYGDVAKAIQGAAKTSQDPEYLGGVVARLVKQVGADTTLQNAERDGAEFAWIPMGDTCAFCLTLASRGWQHISKRTLKNGHAEHIHANCDCTYAVRFNDDTEVEGYNPDKYLRMYYDADGNTPKQRINSMRRDFYAENSEKINKQKRSAYEKRKERESSEVEEYDVN